MVESMSPRARIASFALVLGAAFVAAFALGSALEPVDTEAGGGHGEEAAHAETSRYGEAGGHDEAGHARAGYSLLLTPTDLTRGEGGELRFTIAGPNGEAVTEFDQLHERRMHLIVVRRDGTGFQHLHPKIDTAGTWSVPVEFAAAGPYRAFADFSVGGEQHTLAGDLEVSGGAYGPRPFPTAAPVDTTSGYEVRLDADAPRAGAEARLTFAVTQGGEEVGDLQPYLGAKGHLVALREGDLEYLHVHPEQGGHEHGDEPAAAHPNEIAFVTSFPSAGRYRLYLQFRHEGVVRTVEFTVEVPR